MKLGNFRLNSKIGTLFVVLCMTMASATTLSLTAGSSNEVQATNAEIKNAKAI